MTFGPAEKAATIRELRIIAILDAARRVGLTPLPSAPMHTLAYLSDALAPVWGLPILDGQILKQIRPYYPSFQADLDRLVGRGIVVPSEVGYEKEGLHWRLRAKYELNENFACRVLEVAEAFSLRTIELRFVREVVYATSGLGVPGLADVSVVDATYSDPLIDLGGMIEVQHDWGEGENRTAAVAMRFGELLGKESAVSAAEMINLYVRRLYERLEPVA